MRIRTLQNTLAAALVVATSIAHAETTRRDAGADSAALLRAQGQVRELAAQRDALQAELDQTKKEMTDKEAAHKKQTAELKESLSDAENRLSQAQNQNTRAQEGNDALRDRIKDQHEKMQKLVDKYKELVGMLRTLESERSELHTTSSAQQRQLETCAKDNVKLYDAGMELLERYANKGVWDALIEKEPVTQLKRVEMENLVQDYRQRVNAARFDTAASNAAN
jgi:chromosome segregation ATPase